MDIQTSPDPELLVASPAAKRARVLAYANIISLYLYNISATGSHVAENDSSCPANMFFILLYIYIHVHEYSSLKLKFKIR